MSCYVGTTQAGQSLCSAACLALTPPTGYTINAQCELINVNECAPGAPPTVCSSNAYCLDTNGSYTCQCWGTYYGDGRVCSPAAYKVYTVVDVPHMLYADYATIQAQVKLVLGNAFVAGITAGGVGADATYTQATQTQLAQTYVSVTRDPNSLTNTRLVLSTLFGTQSIARAVAVAVDPVALGVNLSLALTAGGMSRNDTVIVSQGIDVMQYSAQGFGIAQTMTGWGLNVSNVVFNRTCTAMGTAPAKGCWEVDVQYYGGQADTTTGQMGLNTFFVSRVPRNLSDTSVFGSVTVSAEVQNTKNPIYPCQSLTTTTSGRLQPAATACCLRDMADSRYYVASGMKEFLSSSLFTNAVPASLCAGGVFNDTSPASNIVSSIPIPDGGTNDLVVGGIDGMPMSEVKHVQLVDLVTRTYRVHLTLSEDDLLTHAATAFTGFQSTSYTASFFIGLANFEGTGTSALKAHFATQNIAVSKSDVMTLSTYGANQVCNSFPKSYTATATHAWNSV